MTKSTLLIIRSDININTCRVIPVVYFYFITNDPLIFLFIVGVFAKIANTATFIIIFFLFQLTAEGWQVDEISPKSLKLPKYG